MFNGKHKGKSPVCILKRHTEETNKMDIYPMPLIKIKLKRNPYSVKLREFANVITKNKIISWDVKSKNHIGNGMEGNVEIVEYAKNNRSIKLVIKTSRNCTRSSRYRAGIEAKMRQCFSSDLVTEGLVTIFPTDDEDKIIMPIYEFTLCEFIKKQRQLYLNFVPDILLQLLKGIRKIHLAGYLHGDIHDENILVNCDKKSVESVIADYGLSQRHNCTEHGCSCYYYELQDIMNMFPQGSSSPELDRIRHDIWKNRKLDPSQYNLYINRLKNFIRKIKIFRNKLRILSKVKVKICKFDTITFIKGIIIAIERYRTFVIFPDSSENGGWFYHEDNLFADTNQQNN